MADDQIEAAVERTVFGTWQIGTRRWGWVRSAEGIGAKAGRIAIGLSLMYCAGALGLHWPWVGAGEIGTLLAWGYTKAEPTKHTTAAAEDVGEAEATMEEIILQMVVDLIGNDTAIHLDTLLAHLREVPVWAAMDRDDLRRLLHAAGCPVRRAVRVGPRTGLAGVHLTDAQHALDALAEDDTPLPPPDTPEPLSAV